MYSNNIQFTKLELRLVTFVFKHFNSKYNARQLAKMLHVNHAHVGKLCKVLVSKLLFVKEELGNAVYFSYNYNSKVAVNFMEYLLAMEENIFPPNLGVLLHIFSKFRGYIDIGLLFGSSIKSKNFSDVDVLLVYTPLRAKEVRKIKDSIRNSHLFEQPIRYVDVTSKDMVLNRKDSVFYNIITENLIFYGSKEYVEVLLQCRKSIIT